MKESYGITAPAEWPLPLGKTKSNGKPKENASFSMRESYATTALAEWPLPLGKAKGIGKTKENESLTMRESCATTAPGEWPLPLGKTKSNGKNYENAGFSMRGIYATTAPAEWPSPIDDWARANALDSCASAWTILICIFFIIDRVALCSSPVKCHYNGIGKPKGNAGFSMRESYATTAPAEWPLPLGKAKSIWKNLRKMEVFQWGKAMEWIQ